ncbi:patatin-like phospholipase family protein [Antarcticibacterium sp. 1MA-6-2]|uniref:patatin-like phospholipase family protein n=1 Tax=Antarcticibacterium sp. 1MA-6-2 TaxID=2908210 RepID=UPI001F18D812|nr:patatin-like phospholipase family protein [Antarcticibacterium sp. 1MA-6-2]UJH91668.1 patatin-like phospholipase family protein [Antarcticibacterium sp. 1MA-6-2]
MTSQDRIRIFERLTKEFHQELKGQWRNSSDYTNKGHEWIKKIESEYNDSILVAKLYDVLLSETKHFNNISGERLPESLEYEDFVLVMKGGGIKGLAYVGALEILENHYDFSWYTGTSAGGITAILLGSGHTIDELKEILSKKNFADFKDANCFVAIKNLIIKGGLYEAKSFTKWLEELLAVKLESSTAVRLQDLPKKTTVYASRRDKKALIFSSFEDNTKEKNAAFAARCSMSIPLIFTPQSSEGMRVFDGGTQNNFPVEILLENYPNANFLGLYLGPETYKKEDESYLTELLAIWTEATDFEVLKKYKDNIIVIDPYPIRTTQFKLTDQEKNFLLESGKLAALNFLHRIGRIDKSEYEFASRKKSLEETRGTLVRKRKNKKKWRKRFLIGLFFLLLALIFFLIIN